MVQNQSSMSPSILLMDVPDDGSWKSTYWIRFGNKIKYLTIAMGTFDIDTLLEPLGSLPSLPYNDDNWTMAYVSRDAESGELITLFSDEKLAGVRNVWHNTQIDILDLMDLDMEDLKGNVYQVAVRGKVESAINKTCQLPPQSKMIAKIAPFEWEIRYMERETRAYQLLQQTDPTLAPRFLGHIREGDRIIGLLIEKLDGKRRASIDDLPNCERALERFHNLGFLHGDVNRHNFLVGDDDVTLIDFEFFEEDATGEARLLEMQSLSTELADQSTRGMRYMPVSSSGSKNQLAEDFPDQLVPLLEASKIVA